MVEITLKEISAQNNIAQKEQIKQTGFLKAFVESMRIGNALAEKEYEDAKKLASSDRLKEKERLREAKVQKTANRMNITFGERFKDLSTSITKMAKGMNSFKLPSFLKKVLFGAAVLGALRLIYQNWDTIKETWDKVKPKLIKLKEIIIEFVANLKWEQIEKVVKILAAAWVVTKLFIATNVVLSTLKLFLGGIITVANILGAAWLLLPGTGSGGGPAGMAGGPLGRLKHAARRFGLRLLTFAPLLTLLGGGIFAGGTKLAIGMGFSGMAAAAGGGAALALATWLGLSLLGGTIKTLRDANKELEAANTKEEKDKIRKTLLARWSMNVTDYMAAPFVKLTAQIMEDMGADPALVKDVRGVSLGQKIFFDFPYAVERYMSRGFDWFNKEVIKSGRGTEDEKTFGFGSKFKLFGDDMADIPSRLKDITKYANDRMTRNFRIQMADMMLYMGQIPARLNIWMRSYIPWFLPGHMSESEAKYKRHFLDQDLKTGYASSEADHAARENQSKSELFRRAQFRGASRDRKVEIEIQKLLIKKSIADMKNYKIQDPSQIQSQILAAGQLKIQMETLEVLKVQLTAFLNKKDYSFLPSFNSSQGEEFGLYTPNARGANQWDGQ